MREDRALRIIATTIELAEQGGFEAVRLRDVAAHAGVAAYARIVFAITRAARGHETTKHGDRTNPHQVPD